MKKIFAIPTLIALFLSLQYLAACSKNNSSNPNPAPAAVTYGIVGGNCMASNGQQAPMTSCNGMGNGMFSLTNGVCRNNQNGQNVDMNYCMQNGQYGNNGYGYNNGYGGQYGNNGYGYNNGYGGQYGNNGYGTGQGMQCVGTFYYMGNGTQQVVACNGVNCRGYTLYTAQGQAVYCQ